MTCAFRSAMAPPVFGGRALTALIAFGRLAAVCWRGGREEKLLYIRMYTYLLRWTWGPDERVSERTDREWKRKKLLRHFERGVGGSCTRRGDRHEIRRKEVIIKTRWDRARGHSISSRTGARTFSFNPTGHHLSENFSIRFKEPAAPCVCVLIARTFTKNSDPLAPFVRTPRLIVVFVSLIRTSICPRALSLTLFFSLALAYVGVLYNYYPRTNLHKRAPEAWVYRFLWAANGDASMAINEHFWCINLLKTPAG